MWCGSIMTFLLRGRRSIWCGCKVMPVAPRIVNDVSYVMRINHHIPFAWQAQYLVRLEWDSCRSAHSKWRFICDADQSWHSFCVAFILRGRRNIWGSWRVMSVALRIANDVSYAMRINHEIHFAWQAQYLVKLEAAFCCSAQCKWRFICDADQSWSTL